MKRSLVALCTFLAACASSQGAAPNASTLTADTSRIQPVRVMDVWPGAAPGSEQAAQREVEGLFNGQPIVRNVTHPTLTVFLPDPSIATGAGVVVAPGGGFMFLSIDNEGISVARALAARGIAAFVLKYRTHATPEDEGQFLASLGAMMARPSAGVVDPSELGVADAVRAIAIVRDHANEWGVDPQRVGMVGFSAGARVTLGALIQEDPAARPNFAAPIYGGRFGGTTTLPRDLPPVFAAVAMDDFVVDTVLDFLTALRASGARPEFHLYGAGGHGFGMTRQGATSDLWFEQFCAWMDANGFLQASAPATAGSRQFNTTETPIGDLLDSAAARAVLERHVPDIVNAPQIAMARSLTLQGLQAFSPGLSDAMLAAVDRDLAALPPE